MDIKKALSGSALFKDLSAASLNALAAVSIHRAVKKKAILFMEGDQGHSLYLLCSGSVQLSKSSPEGAEIVIRTIVPGEVFGEVVLFEQDHYPATAATISESEVLLLPRKQINGLLDEPSFRKDFIAMLLKKQRYLAERILHLTSFEIEGRFFQFLRDHYGEDNPIRIGMSKKDLAAAIGATPESLSRLIQRLSAQGLIAWKDDLLEIRRSSP